MTSEFTLYDNFRKNLANGVIDLANDTIKLALVQSAHVISNAHEVFASIDHEVAAGGGYTTGGETLTGQTVVKDISKANFDANDVSWAALTATFRYGILYCEKVAAITNPLIGWILFDNTPADVVKAGTSHDVIWNPTGIINLA